MFLLTTLKTAPSTDAHFTAVHHLTQVSQRLEVTFELWQSSSWSLCSGPRLLYL